MLEIETSKLSKVSTVIQLIFSLCIVIILIWIGAVVQTISTKNEPNDAQLYSNELLLNLNYLAKQNLLTSPKELTPGWTYQSREVCIIKLYYYKEGQLTEDQHTISPESQFNRLTFNLGCSSSTGSRSALTWQLDMTTSSFTVSFSSNPACDVSQNIKEFNYNEKNELIELSANLYPSYLVNCMYLSNK